MTRKVKMDKKLGWGAGEEEGGVQISEQGDGGMEAISGSIGEMSACHCLFFHEARKDGEVTSSFLLFFLGLMLDG